MAGESKVSVPAIEQRADDLEAKLAEQKPAEEKPAEEKPAEEQKPVDEKKPEVKSASDHGTPPSDAKELRKWATKVAMDNAEIRKQIETLTSMLTKSQKAKVDWKELAKDPAKLEKMIESREQELVNQHTSEYNEKMNQATAEITNYESKQRANDAENFPRWNELLPVMRALSEPKPGQESGDPRINFNQHPKLILDELYDLAKQVADADPNWKKPAAAAAGKTFTQEEVNAQIEKAKADALSEAEKNLNAERKGAGVGGMGKGSSKSKPGDVNKEVLQNMPLGDLKSALQKATDQLHG